jgi:hypothetical protein
VIRKNAVRMMLTYRAANLRDREKWLAILDEGFIFTLPLTPYRSFHKGDIVSSSRVIVGVDAAIADAASLVCIYIHIYICIYIYVYIYIYIYKHIYTYTYNQALMAESVGLGTLSLPSNPTPNP